MKWSDEEIKKLIKLFPTTTNKELAIILNRTERQIKSKSFRLKLKKNTEHKSKLRSKTNKEMGRDLNECALKEIAIKYKTRSEFQRLDSSAYTTARVKGILDEICKHMIKLNYSTPQLILSFIISKLVNTKILYNNRKIIKPYELDIFLPEYDLAFEYDGKRWHVDNNNDLIKNNMCYQNDITLIRIAENNRDYINDIKIQLIDKIDLINTCCNSNITKKDIECIKREDINSFVNENIKRKEKVPRKLWKVDNIREEIEKYEYLSDFIANSKGCYLHIKRNKLDRLLNRLKRKREILNDEKVKKEIDKYSTLSDFRINSRKFYEYVKRYRKFELIKHLTRHKNWKNRKK